MAVPSGATTGVSQDIYIAAFAASQKPDATAVKTPAKLLVSGNLCPNVTDFGDVSQSANASEFTPFGKSAAISVAAVASRDTFDITIVIDESVALHQTMLGWGIGQAVEIGVRNRKGLKEKAAGNASCDYIKGEVAGIAKGRSTDGFVQLTLTIAPSETDYIKGAD